jgi:hypothetical protein
MENQHMIIKLNEAEKYLSSSEYEIHQQLQTILNDIKVRNEYVNAQMFVLLTRAITKQSKATLYLPLISSFKCSECSIPMTCPEEVSPCLHAFCTGCTQALYERDTCACPVCQHPMDDTRNWDKDAIKRFRNFYLANKGNMPSSENIPNTIKMKCRQWTRKSLSRIIPSSKSDKNRQLKEIEPRKTLQTTTAGNRINMGYPLLRTSIVYL